MRLSLNNMRSRAKDLEELIRIKKRSIINAPEGHVRISKVGSGTQIYFLGEGTDYKRKYLCANDRDIAIQLAQKEYDMKVLKLAESELRTLNILIHKYENGICDDVYSRINESRRKFVKPIVLPDDEFVEEWLGEPYEGLGFDEDTPEHYSARGLRVRSKNEAMADDKFCEFGVPSKFECPLHLKHYGTVYPDFTLLNVRTRSVKYLEILGMMDDSVYAEKYIGKIRAYQRNGHILGRDLLILFDTPRYPLNPGDIELLIKNFLL
ncbi:MAG: hypothetical protein IKS99_04785 [Firmicutes bacterium]|nr:hypothetical protein [Bacillota bacterium]